MAANCTNRQCHMCDKRALGYIVAIRHNSKSQKYFVGLTMTLRLVWKKIIWFVTRSWKESNKISHISQNISSITLHTCILKLECGILKIISIGDISLRTFRNCKQKKFPYNFGHTALTHVNILNLTQIKHRRESLQFLIEKICSVLVSFWQ